MARGDRLTGAALSRAAADRPGYCTYPEHSPATAGTWQRVNPANKAPATPPDLYWLLATPRVPSAPPAPVEPPKPPPIARVEAHPTVIDSLKQAVSPAADQSWLPAQFAGLAGVPYVINPSLPRHGWRALDRNGQVVRECYPAPDEAELLAAIDRDAQATRGPWRRFLSRVWPVRNGHRSPGKEGPQA